MPPAAEPSSGFEVVDRPERGRFEITVDGERAGFAAYHRIGDTLDFTHTEVDDRYEGRGVGSALISAALDSAQQRGLDVLPHCPFVRGYIERHPAYLPLVPAARRGQFGLSE